MHIFHIANYLQFIEVLKIYMYLYDFKCFVFANDLYAKIVTNIDQINIL